MTAERGTRSRRARLCQPLRGSAEPRRRCLVQSELELQEVVLAELHNERQGKANAVDVKRAVTANAHWRTATQPGAPL